MTPIPLFPLQQVLFPDGILHLQIFEVRYLHMIRRCIEEEASFGVVGLLSGGEVRKPGEEETLTDVGTLARVETSETVMPGLMRVQCRGSSRFLVENPQVGQFGLWMGEVKLLAPDPELPVPPALQRSADVLGSTIADMQRRLTTLPLAPPFRLDDCAWVANRLAELLPISVVQKAELLEMADPQRRLAWLDRWLEGRGAWD